MPDTETREQPKIGDGCPHCSHTGRVVPINTVRALVSISLRLLDGDNYRFCGTAGCPVIYYHGTSDHCLYQSDLRELVFQKHMDNPQVLVCYCFRHTMGAIASANASQAAHVIANIREGIQRHQCACDIRNPQGSCCLGTVQRLLRAVTE